MKTAGGDAPAALLAGKGKYAKLTWDENQTQLAFLSDRDDAAAKQPKWKLYQWDRKSPAATVLVSGDMPGFRKEFAISDKGALEFLQGRHARVLRLRAAAAGKEGRWAEAAADDNKAVVDLWSYKDDYIQPIQKVRADRDRNRTFTAAYLIPERKIVQLGRCEAGDGDALGEPAVGAGFRRPRVPCDGGLRRALLRRVPGGCGDRRAQTGGQQTARRMTWSPSGRYLLTFDGKDWIPCLGARRQEDQPDGGAGVKFFNEDTDTPSTPGPYGSAGWTKDGKSVLIYDRYDIWRVSPDGSGAKNITAGYGRAHDLRLRYIRTEAENPRERWIDGSKPVMLQAENLKTFETGFFPRFAGWGRAEATGQCRPSS